MNKFDRIVIALLVLLVLQSFSVGTGFLLGVPCQGWYFWAALVASLCIVWRSEQKIRSESVFVILALTCLVMTMFTFTYNGPDALSCHVPIQRAIVGGWNPIYENSTQGIQSHLQLEDTTGLRLTHALYAPKFTHYVGASTAKALGLWVGDAFVGWVLLVALVLYGASFSRKYLNAGRTLSLCFPICLLSTSVLLLMFDGFVDFTIYAAMVLLALSLLQWNCWHKKTDALIAIFSAIICLTSKATGILFVLTFWLYACLIGRGFKSRLFWCVTALCILVACLIGASPFFTMWIGGTSSLDALNSDFVGNPDAEKMGYLARISWAWCSRWLTSKACCWWYGQQSFSPIWQVSVSGRSALWTMLFWCSLLLLAISRKRNLVVVCSLLLFTSLATPLKYVGYARYCPQIGLIPILAFFSVADRKWLKWVILLLMLYVIPTVLSIIACFAYTQSLERFRQDQIAELKRRNVTYSFPGPATLLLRLRQAGLQVSPRRERGEKLLSLQSGDFRVFKSADYPAWNSVRRSDMDFASGLKPIQFQYLARLMVHPPRPIFECGCAKEKGSDSKP